MALVVTATETALTELMSPTKLGPGGVHGRSRRRREHIDVALAVGLDGDQAPDRPWRLDVEPDPFNDLLDNLGPRMQTFLTDCLVGTGRGAEAVVGGSGVGTVPGSGHVRNFGSRNRAALSAARSSGRRSTDFRASSPVLAAIIAFLEPSINAKLNGHVAGQVRRPWSCLSQAISPSLTNENRSRW